MPRGNVNEDDAQGVVLPFPGRPPKPAPSLKLIARQATAYLEDLRPLFEQPEVRRGLFRLVRLLNRKTSTGAAIRMLALHAANALGEMPEAELGDWVRSRVTAALREVIAARPSGKLAQLPRTDVYLQYRTEGGNHGS